MNDANSTSGENAPSPRELSRDRPHPWHGLAAGPDPPEIVTAYIEITPFDRVKYEIDKESGYLRVDRPQLTSSLPPTLYGFIPRTYCGKRVGSLSDRATDGDGDALDICVVTERPIGRSDTIVTARVLGVLRATDRGLADDKIVSVLQNDPLWGDTAELDDLPSTIVDRLRHYFTTYKMSAGIENPMEIERIAGRREALEIVRASMEDYATYVSEYLS